MAGEPVASTDTDTDTTIALLARLNGVALTAEEVAALRPAYLQMQGWLAALRRAVAAEEEPATIFVAQRNADHGPE